MPLIHEIIDQLDAAIDGLQEMKRELVSRNLDHPSLSVVDKNTIEAKPDLIIASGETVGKFYLTLNDQQIYQLAQGWGDETEVVEVPASILEVVDAVLSQLLPYGREVTNHEENSEMLLAWAECLDAQAARLRKAIGA